METDAYYFFEKHKGALPFYEKLEERLVNEIENVQIKYQKSQISFYNRHMFACVSFMPVKKKKERPLDWMVVTFGLDHQVFSDRITLATEPYPARWTHHVLISSCDEIDDELMRWIKEAAQFSRSK